MINKDVSNADIDRSGSLNFKVDVEFKRTFKAYAASRGLTMVELLKEGFALSQKMSEK